MNWRVTFDTSTDIYFKRDVLRAVLSVRNTVHEISDCIVRMELLPIGLQSSIAWDIVCDPVTTIKQFNRVKDNASLLAGTSRENIKAAWLRSHGGNLTQHAPDVWYAPVQMALFAPEVLSTSQALSQPNSRR